MIDWNGATNGRETFAHLPLPENFDELEDLRSVPISVTHPYIELIAEAMPYLPGVAVYTTSDVADVLYEWIELPDKPWAHDLSTGRQKGLIDGYVALHPRITLLDVIREKSSGRRILCYMAPQEEEAPSLPERIHTLLDVLDTTGLAEQPADQSLTVDDCMTVADELSLRGESPGEKTLFAHVFRRHRRVDLQHLRLQHIRPAEEVVFPATTGQAFDQTLSQLLSQPSKRPRDVGKLSEFAFGRVVIDRESSDAFHELIDADPRLISAGRDSEQKELYVLYNELMGYPSNARQRELRAMGRTILGNLVKTEITSIPPTLVVTAIERLQGAKLSPPEQFFVISYLVGRFLNDRYDDGRIFELNERTRYL